jgi:hypothetical protein
MHSKKTTASEWENMAWSSKKSNQDVAKIIDNEHQQNMHILCYSINQTLSIKGK